VRFGLDIRASWPERRRSVDMAEAAGGGGTMGRGSEGCNVSKAAPVLCYRGLAAERCRWGGPW
jgi:hypothetical protein